MGSVYCQRCIEDVLGGQDDGERTFPKRTVMATALGGLAAATAGLVGPLALVPVAAAAGLIGDMLAEQKTCEVCGGTEGLFEVWETPESAQPEHQEPSLGALLIPARFSEL